MEQDDRIAATAAYYDRHQLDVARRSDQRDWTRPLAEFLARYRDELGAVLDVGCGTGDHLQTFLDAGIDAIGVDPSSAMRSECTRRGLKVIDGAFETLPALELPPIGGVWCAASLLHVRAEDLGRVLRDVRSLLQEGGPLFATVRVGDGATWDDYDGSGAHRRFIQLYTRAALIAELETCGFRVEQGWTERSTWGRQAQWLSVIAMAEPIAQGRNLRA